MIALTLLTEVYMAQTHDLKLIELFCLSVTNKIFTLYLLWQFVNIMQIEISTISRQK